MERTFQRERGPYSQRHSTKINGEFPFRRKPVCRNGFDSLGLFGVGEGAGSREYALCWGKIFEKSFGETAFGKLARNQDKWYLLLLFV